MYLQVYPLGLVSPSPVFPLITPEASALELGGVTLCCVLTDPGLSLTLTVTTVQGHAWFMFKAPCLFSWVFFFFAFLYSFICI